MEVVRKNFKETLPLISSSIDKADFLVIDAEFTGLMNGPDVSIFDSPKEYYDRLFNGSTGFLLIQFGLSAFYWDAEKNRYMNDTYNFYLFPRGRPGPEKVFLCQSSSLDFLSAQGFDFNKVIRDGISYMTEPVETKLRENLIERQKHKDKDIINIPEENKPYIEEICQKVRNFIDEKKSDVMEIDRCNAFIRLLIFQELKQRFKDEIMVETKILENKNRLLKITRVKCQDDMKNHDAMKNDKEWEELEDAVGFSKVARMISQSEKLVVGHNMLLDVLHTLNHFFQPLPEDYSAFKEFAHCMFPSLLDTKYMSSIPPFKDKVNSSVLNHLLATLSEAPFSLPEVGCEAGRGYTLGADKQHEAGYDAYITGLCFLALHAECARGRVRSAAPALKPYLNKLFLGKTAHQDSPYINLDGDDPAPSRDHVFHLTFPREWTRNDINQLFSPFGPVIVQFEDDSHALVALCKRENARHAVRGLSGHNNVTLRPYEEYKNMLHKSQRHPSEYESTQPAIITNVPEMRPFLPLPAPIFTPLATVATMATSMRTLGLQLDAPVMWPAVRPTAMPSQPCIVARKRTSSGVFQVDDAEPSPKKAERTRSNSEGAIKKTKLVSNGKRKVKESPEKKDATEKTSKKKEKKDKIIESFDKKAKNTCVAAFKESDSWD